MRNVFKLATVLALLSSVLLSTIERPAYSAASRELEKVRIGYSVGRLIPFPLIVAKENRFFEQAGFDAELINIPPTIAVTALISGDIQYVVFAARPSMPRYEACWSNSPWFITIDRCSP